MKNLKKTLAALLAAAMTMALIVLPVSAATLGRVTYTAPVVAWEITESTSDYIGWWIADEYEIMEEQISIDITYNDLGISSVSDAGQEYWVSYATDKSGVCDDAIKAYFYDYSDYMSAPGYVISGMDSSFATYKGRTYFRFKRNGNISQPDEQSDFQTILLVAVDSDYIYEFSYQVWWDGTNVHESDFWNLMNSVTIDSPAVSTPEPANTPKPWNDGGVGSSGDSEGVTIGSTSGGSVENVMVGATIIPEVSSGSIAITEYVLMIQLNLAIFI